MYQIIFIYIILIVNILNTQIKKETFSNCFFSKKQLHFIKPNQLFFYFIF